MSLAQSLANIIQNEAFQRGQLGIQAAGIIPNAIAQGADTLQGALNQMSLNKTRGLQQAGMEQQNQLQGIALTKAKKNQADEAEIEQILKAIPDGPDAMQQRSEAFIKFWQAKDPDKALKIQQSLSNEKLINAHIEQYKAQTKAQEAAALKAMQEKPGGTVIPQGGAYIPYGENQPSFTNPIAPKEFNPSDANDYVKLKADEYKSATGKEATAGQKAKWQLEYKNSTTQLRLENPTPPTPPSTQLTTITDENGKTQLVEYTPGKGGPGSYRVIKEGAIKGVEPTAEKKAGAEIEASQEKITNIKKLYKPEYVGPITGRANLIKMKVPGVSVDKDLAKFVAANETLKNQVIKDITGAQMSEQEANRILKQVPTMEDKPAVWEAKYDLTLENQKMMKQKMKGAGYRMGGAAAPSAPTTAPRTTGRPKTWAELKAAREAGQ